MGLRGGSGARSERSRSKFLVGALSALALCLIIMLGAVFGCLSVLNRINDRMQNLLAVSLDNEIGIASAETSFSGTLYNLSDELVNNPTLVALGSQDGLDAEERAAAWSILSDVATRTQSSPAQRYLYFAQSDYLMDAAQDDANARGAVAAPVDALLDELATRDGRGMGAYENHVGRYDGANYQLMVRTVAPYVYYVSYFPSFNANVPASFSDFEDVQMYYYDQFGNQVACSEATDVLGAYTYASLGPDDTGVVYGKHNGKDYVGVYCTSHSRNLRMAIFFADEAQGMRQLATGASVLVVGVMLLCLVVMGVAVQRLYRPVNVLARTLEHTGEGTAGARTVKPALLRDDGAIIAEALDAYQTSVDKQRDLLNTAWVYRLLLDDNPDILGDYEDAWVARLQGRPYTVVVVRSDDGCTGARVGEVAQPALAASFDCRFLTISNELVAIVSLADSCEDDLVACLQELQRTHAELVLSAFVGVPRTAIEEIATCFNEALSVGEACLVQEVYGVVRRASDAGGEDLMGAGEFRVVEEIPRLVRRIGSLDTEGALAVFDHMAMAMKAQAKGLGTAAAEAQLALVVSSMVLAVEMLASSRADLPAGWDEDVNGLRHAKSLATARSALANVLRRLTCGEERADSQKMFESLKAFVRVNYRDAGLSAGSLARQMGVSQSQITKLFKRYNNTTFLAYVHGLRLTEATDLLLHTDLTEHEIAQRVGYNNTVTMVRAFKKYRNVVPSSLRKVG